MAMAKITIEVYGLPRVEYADAPCALLDGWAVPRIAPEVPGRNRREMRANAARMRRER